MLKIKHSNTDIALYAALLIVTILSLSHYSDVRFASNDSLVHYLAARDISSFFLSGLNMAKSMGRFQYFLTFPIGNLPYIIDHPLYFAAFQWSGLILNLISVFWLTRLLTRSIYAGVVSAALFITLLQYDLDHSSISCYIPAFQIAVSLILFSIGNWFLYLKTSKKKYFYLSLLSYFFSIFLYEFCCLYIIAHISIWIENIYRKNKPFTKYHTDFIRQLSPYITVCFIFIFLTLIFRHFYQPHYSGTNFAKNIKLLDYFKAVILFAKGTLPGWLFFDMKYREFFDYYSNQFRVHGVLLAPFAEMKAAWLVKMALIVSIMNLGLKRINIALTRRHLWVIIILSVAFVLIPYLLPCLTEKFYARVGKGYIKTYTYTYFSYFGFMLIVVTILMVANSKLKSNRLFYRGFRVSIACLVAILGLYIDFANHYTAKLHNEHGQKWKMVKSFIKRSEFKEIGNGAHIFAPSLYHSPVTAYYITQKYRWKKYFLVNTGKAINIGSSVEKAIRAINNGENVYWLAYGKALRSEDQYIVFGLIMDFMKAKDGQYSFYSDEVKVFTPPGYGRYSVVMNTKEPVGSISLDESHLYSANTEHVRIKINKQRISEGLLCTKIKAKAIDIGNIIISSFDQLTSNDRGQIDEFTYYSPNTIIQVESGWVNNAIINNDLENNENFIIFDKDTSVKLGFMIDHAGYYQLRLRTVAENRKRDSIFVKLDNGEKEVWHQRAHSIKWKWRNAPSKWFLESGGHIIDLSYRELLSVDKVELVKVDEITKDKIK